MAADEGYARPELLAEPDWLWERRADPKVRVIDCDGLDAYRRAHISGAVGLPVHPWIKESQDGIYVMGPDAFADLMGKLGVSDETTVVTYDGFNSSYATRLWWVLNYYGHTNAKVLNGGWHRWLTEGRPITFHETTPEPARFTPRTNEAILCRLHYLKEKLAEPGVQVMNVLPEDIYLGRRNPFGNKRVGHIPGSVNVPIEKFVTSDDRRVFKSASELRVILDQAGITPKSEVIVHCQAGIRTTLGVFVLFLLGWDRVRAYDAAMAEWANRDDTPLVVE
ncbi:MAG: sulfurtransferase [Chloroflexi bacterium]|nr:sulfurtransferase [Chloroflexota bacterium]